LTAGVAWNIMVVFAESISVRTETTDQTRRAEKEQPQ
jgi:hypothetical protein